MNNLFMAQLQSCKWAMEPFFLESFVKQVAELEVTEALKDIEIAGKPRTYQVIGGKAVIKISGVLLKTVPSWLRFWGIEATGYDEIQAQLDQAMNDDSITGIHLQIESPGGIVDGLVDTADAIFNARQTKKVTATIEDLGASAAYWLASQAETIDANRTTEVGSIGVYTVYLDSSKLADNLGFKVVLIKSGEIKGMGVSGVEITDKQIAAVQENIDAIADQFVESVARGRVKDKDTIEILATGQLWIAAKAKKLGLIDRVTNITRQNNSQKIQSQGEQTMETKENEQVTVEQVDTKKLTDDARDAERARMKDLQKEFADDPEFAIKAFGEGKNLEQAKGDYCEVLRGRLKDQAAAAQTEQTADGAEAISTEDTDNTGTGDFIAEAKQMASEKKISVTAAMKILNRKSPKLHETFLQRSATEGKQMYAEAI